MRSPGVSEDTIPCTGSHTPAERDKDRKETERQTNSTDHTARHGRLRPRAPLKTSLWCVTKATGADRLPPATETTRTQLVNIGVCVPVF